MTAAVCVRRCLEADLPACLDIYAVHAGDPSDRVTFEESVPTLEDMRLRRKKVVETLGLPFLVATAQTEAEPGTAAGEDERVVVGYAYCSAFRARAAYRHSAEVSIYVCRGCRGRGVGSLLMEALIERARIRNVHTLISVMGTEVDNPPSVYLHLKHGFRKVGVLKEVGCKHGTYIDRLLMEKILDGS